MTWNPSFAHSESGSCSRKFHLGSALSIVLILSFILTQLIQVSPTGATFVETGFLTLSPERPGDELERDIDFVFPGQTFTAQIKRVRTNSAKRRLRFPS